MDQQGIRGLIILSISSWSKFFNSIVSCILFRSVFIVVEFRHTKIAFPRFILAKSIFKNKLRILTTQKKKGKKFCKTVPI